MSASTTPVLDAEASAQAAVTAPEAGADERGGGPLREPLDIHPAEIFSELRRGVLGQDRALRFVSVAIYKHTSEGGTQLLGGARVADAQGRYGAFAGRLLEPEGRLQGELVVGRDHVFEAGGVDVSAGRDLDAGGRVRDALDADDYVHDTGSVRGVRFG
jgi:hypothetical protein